MDYSCAIPSLGLERALLPVGGAKPTLVNPSRACGKQADISKLSLQCASRIRSSGEYSTDMPVCPSM